MTGELLQGELLSTRLEKAEVEGVKVICLDSSSCNSSDVLLGLYLTVLRALLFFLALSCASSPFSFRGQRCSRFPEQLSPSLWAPENQAGRRPG